MDCEVQFTSVIDQILIYHREKCIDMHIQSDADVREIEYYKAEAAREIMMLLARDMLKSRDSKTFQEELRQKLSSVYQAVFFDPATRGMINRSKEASNGGQK